MQDSGYCYMDDVGMGEFSPEDYEVRIEGRKRIPLIKGKPARDPDAVSRRLYDDLCGIYAGKTLPCGLKGSGKVEWAGGAYQIAWKVGESVFRMGSDYIAPSTGWAIRAGVPDLEIGASLLRGRTLGGHILWPRCGVANSVNSARGGTSSFCDRIDLTLIDLKRWSLGEDCKLKRVWDANSDYLFLFVPEGEGRESLFPGFVEFWDLQDFVDGSGEPILLADSDHLLWKRGASDYIAFMEANLAAIELRSKRIVREDYDNADANALDFEMTRYRETFGEQFPLMMLQGVDEGELLEIARGCIALRRPYKGCCEAGIRF